MADADGENLRGNGLAVSILSVTTAFRRGTEEIPVKKTTTTTTHQKTNCTEKLLSTIILMPNV